VAVAVAVAVALVTVLMRVFYRIGQRNQHLHRSGTSLRFPLLRSAVRPL